MGISQEAPFTISELEGIYPAASAYSKRMLISRGSQGDYLSYAKWSQRLYGTVESYAGGICY